MANTGFVDSEIFYQKLAEVKASKKPKPSKITPFTDDNFDNDAVTWLETRNEDSKDRTNLTSQDVAIIKRKGWKLEGGKILSKNGKDIFQKCQLDQVLCQRFIAHKGRDKMDKYIKRNYESVVSQEVIQLFVSLCSIHKEQKWITSRQKQPVLSPIQAREFLTHGPNGP